MLSAQHVNTSAALREVYHLLPCHLARTHTHPFLLYAVVGTEQQMARMLQVGREGVLHHAHLLCQSLKLTEGAFGLVEVVNLVANVAAKGFVRSLYMKCLHSYYFTITGNPLTMSTTLSA